MSDTIYETIKDAKSSLDTEKPKQYVITLHNDGSTPFSVVLHVLEMHLNMNQDEAMHTMMTAHTSGNAPCGLYTKDVAESKVHEAMKCPAVAGTELSLTVEPQ